MSFEPAVASGLVARLFPPGSPQALLLLRAAWPTAVGPGLAVRTQLLALERGTLRVRVPDAHWRKVLHRMQPQILARLRSLAGAVAPARLGFDEGRIDLPAAPAASPERLPAEGRCPEAVAQSARLIPDAEIRRLFQESAARYLARQPRFAEESSDA